MRWVGQGLEQAELKRFLGSPLRLALKDIARHRARQKPKSPSRCRLEAYGGNPFLARLLIESGRHLVHTVTVALESAQDPNRREIWVTVGLLKKAMAQFGPASGDHLIARLCAIGNMGVAAQQTPSREGSNPVRKRRR
jgi:hypothetical protein